MRSREKTLLIFIYNVEEENTEYMNDCMGGSTLLFSVDNITCSLWFFNLSLVVIDHCVKTKVQTHAFLLVLQDILTLEGHYCTSEVTLVQQRHTIIFG